MCHQVLLVSCNMGNTFQSTLSVELLTFDPVFGEGAPYVWKCPVVQKLEYCVGVRCSKNTAGAHGLTDHAE